MGYRHYFYKIPKTEIAEIRNLKTNDEFCDWAESKGYKVERYEGEKPYCAVYKIGKEIYEFGKCVDWAFKMQSKNECIFGSEELKEKYEDYYPVICSKDDFLFAINTYKQHNVAYFKGLLEGEEGVPIEKMWKDHIEGKLWEWENPFDIYPIDTDLENERINRSWLYEYAIFELVRVYKTFDFENDALVLLGW